jgi:hypothetical protein
MVTVLGNAPAPTTMAEPNAKLPSKHFWTLPEETLPSWKGEELDLARLRIASHDISH